MKIKQSQCSLPEIFGLIYYQFEQHHLGSAADMISDEHTTVSTPKDENLQSGGKRHLFFSPEFKELMPKAASFTIILEISKLSEMLKMNFTFQSEA